jgi:hypothetical protein
MPKVRGRTLAATGIEASTVGGAIAVAGLKGGAFALGVMVLQNIANKVGGRSKDAGEIAVNPSDFEKLRRTDAYIP